MKENISAQKSFDFAVRIVNLYKYLTRNQKEFIMAKQILRSGTSIGANIAEAQRAQSKADFIAKMQIALKEAYEVDYWLKLLYKTEYLSEKQFTSLYGESREIISILMAICKTARKEK